MTTYMEQPGMSPEDMQQSMEYIKALRSQQQPQSNLVGGVFVQPQPGTAGGGGGAGLNDAMGSMFGKPRPKVPGTPLAPGD